MTQTTTAPDLWTFGDHAAWRNEEIVGYLVEARDGELGTVVLAAYDAGRSYLVVDADDWQPGLSVIVPAGLVERVDVGEGRIVLDRTREAVGSAPQFEADASADEVRARLGEHYAAS